MKVDTQNNRMKTLQMEKNESTIRRAALALCYSVSKYAAHYGQDPNMYAYWTPNSPNHAG